MHIFHKSVLLLVAVLFAACSSSDGDETGGSTAHRQTMLTIHVYSPEGTGTETRTGTRTGTRAETGEVNPIAGESTVYSLKIWVYESETNEYVGYLDTKEVASLNMGEGATYQLPVSDDFAERKPEVDVYVLANVTAANCGVGTLNKDTWQSNLLNEAKIAFGYFGLGTLISSVPEDGLPMAGKLTLQPVVGEAPALRVGTLDEVATVSLTRAVSKLRFVFANAKNELPVTITGITMNAGMIPDEEYFFRTPAGMTYNANAMGLLSTDIDVNETEDPTRYIYFEQDAQAYEDLIDNAGLSVHGPIYLRESDKQLAGTITYTIGDGAPQTADFQMQKAGDFKRNHTWIIYAYYAGSDRLQVQALYVKEWVNREVDHSFYNW